MRIQIPNTGVIKKQTFDIGKDVSIIYGYNNCGKTTILKVLDTVFSNRLMEQFILGRTGDIAVYIPTNRIIVSENKTDEIQLKDCEEFIYYQKDSYKDYSLHLKRLRDQLLTNKIIHQF
ncbi:MAG: ATP-binding protein, partial [Lachnospiraceae bacterium]|nr:ATP-binding protein [Lachnospiraceae bacterium]